MKKPLVILTGPTAVGKTKASISLAKAINGEIISADSMQVYKYMDIGSAKIRTEEMQGVKHYLVDVLEPDEEFHVVRFQQMAKEAMEEIYAKGKVPIIVGGTGFYIQAILNDIDFTENVIHLTVSGSDAYKRIEKTGWSDNLLNNLLTLVFFKGSRSCTDEYLLTDFTIKLIESKWPVIVCRGKSEAVIDETVLS